MYPSCRRERTGAFDLGRIVRFALAAVVFTRVPTELPRPDAAPDMPCEPAARRSVRLLVVNEAAVASEVLKAAAQEAGAIWAEAGVRLEWTLEPASLLRPDTDTLIVVIRQALRTPPALVGGATTPSHALGRISFADDDRPAPMMEVSVDAVTRLVMAGTQFDRPIPKLPLASQRPLVGRALGRVVAHELGHWLNGRGHVHDGVMKAAFGSGDLVESILPLLPPAWRGVLRGTPTAGVPRCRPSSVPAVVGVRPVTR